MPYDKFDQLYDALKADGAVSKSRENFRSKMLAPGAEGYQNRRQLFDALKADGVVESPTYEEFAKRLGLHAVESAQQPTAADAAALAAEPEQKGAAGVSRQQESQQKAQPQADAWRPSPMQQAVLRMQIDSGNARLRQQGEQFKQRTENIMKGNKSGAFMGERELNPQTGEMETKYYTRQGSQTDTQLEQSRENTEYRRWWEDNTEAGQRSKALRLKNEKERQLDEMQADVDSRIEQNEENLHELYGQRAKQLDEGGKWNDDEGFWSNFVRIVGGAANRSVTANAPKAKESKTKADKDISTYLAENQILEDARKMLETRDLKRSNGFMGGFWNIPNNFRNMKRGAAHTLSDPDLYAGGVVALEKASQMLGIEDKLKQGEELSDAELNLVYSAMLGQDVQSNTKTPHGYNIAQITVEMVPFLVQMMTNPASGLSRAMVTKFGKSGLKKIALSKAAQGLTGEAAEKFAKKEMRKLAAKTTGVQVLGDLGESAVLANTWQAPKTAADAMGRYQGNVAQDANGNIVFDGNHQLGEAIYKAEASAIIENYTEMLGEHFGIIGNAAKKGVDKGLRAIGGGKIVDAVSDMVSKIGASEWGTAIANIEKRAHWNGTINEVLEEEAGIVLNSLFTGDNKLSDLTDKDQQIDIVLGVGLFGGFMSGVKTTGYMVGKARSEGKLHERDRIGKARFGDNWDSIRKAIQEAEEKDLGTTIQDLTQNFAESNEQARSIVEYAQALMRARGFNIASASVRAQNSEPDNAIEAEVTQSYTDGYEASTPQEMNDAQNMYEHQRQRAEGMFDASMLDRLDANPTDALMEMSQNGLYPQEEIDAALDYINAKMTRDGIIQRVNDDIDEQIAQSHAMINARVNPATGMIQPATIGLDDRQVYVVGGKIAVNGEGKVDRDASDESIIIRDLQTGHLEFTDIKSIVSVGEPIDPDMERAMAVDGIRQQAAQAAADAMNGTLAFNPGDVVTINDGGELVQCTIVGPLIDESTGKPAEDLLDVRFPDGSQIAFTKEQLQQSVDAVNRERIKGVDRERAAARAQQRAAEAEAMRPKFALNDEFTILNDAGIPIRGSVTSEIDEDGTVEIYTEEPINGNKVNHFTPAELEEMIDTYNGSPTQDVSTEEAVLSEEDSLTLPTDNDTNDGYGNGPQQDNDGSAGNDSGTVARDAAGSVASNRDRSTIRSYEEGLAAHQYAHTDDSERNRREKESERLVGIAKANGQYFDRDRKSVVGTKNAKSTGESEVYVDKDGKKIYKVKDPYAKSPMKGDVQPEDVIYEHLVHNKYFPETAYGFEGISDDMGDVRIVLSQDYVESVGQPTTEQIESALAEKGLLPEGRYTYGNEEISVTDVTGDNALLGADGKVYFIDPIINFKKPVREILGETEESPQEEITALQRIPRDAEGRPDYEAADTETAWDALVESAKGNEERAKRVAEGMVKQKRTELERVKKLTPPNPGKGKYLSPEELIEWEESHDAMTEGAEAALAKWIAVGRVQQDRQAAAKKAADEERQRQAAELWEQQKEQQRQEEAARKTAEAEAEARRSEIAAQQAIAEKEAAERRDSHIGKAESAFDEYLQQLRDNVVSRHITPEYRKQMEREDRAKGPSQYASMYANWESPQSLEEYIARVLSTNDKRVKWSGAGNLAGELYGQEKMSERKEHSWMTSDTNGMSFAKFIHGIWEGLIGENGVSFNNHVYTDQDVRNAVIDALRSNPTSRGLYEQALNMHRSNGNDNMQLRSELDELLMHEDEIRDEWYNEHFHMSAEEYEAAEEQMLASIRESGITDEDICAMASETIDEYINSNYYGTERNQGSNQVLSGTQIDDTIGGEEAVIR